VKVGHRKFKQVQGKDFFQLEDAMVKIICDACGAVRHPNTERAIAGGSGWIQGYDIETHSASGISRSIRFQDHFDDRRVTEMGAIHFCCTECRDDYVAGKTRAA